MTRMDGHAILPLLAPRLYSAALVRQSVSQQVYTTICSTYYPVMPDGRNWMNLKQTTDRTMETSKLRRITKGLDGQSWRSCSPVLVLPFIVIASVEEEPRHSKDVSSGQHNFSFSCSEFTERFNGSTVAEEEAAQGISGGRQRSICD